MKKQLFRRRNLLFLVIPLLAMTVFVQATSAVPKFTTISAEFSHNHVRGNTRFLLVADGKYQWTGHLHNEGFWAYDFALACAKSVPGAGTFVWTHTGSIAGDVNLPSSKSHDWDRTFHLSAIYKHWDALLASRSEKLACALTTDGRDVSNAVSVALGLVKVLGIVIQVQNMD